MKKSSFMASALVFGLVALMSATAAMAAPRGGFRCPGEMTREEQAVVQPLFAEHEKAVYSLRESIRAKRAELDALYYSGSKDSAKVQAVYREMADLKAKLFMARLDLKAKLAEKGFTDFDLRGGPDCGGPRGRHGYGGYGGRHGGWRNGGHGGWHNGYGPMHNGQDAGPAGE